MGALNWKPSLKNLVVGAFLTLFGLGAGGAVKAATIDQNSGEPPYSYGFCYITGALCGQSFQQSASNISGAGFYLGEPWGGIPGDITISVYSNYSSTPSGLIATGTTSVAAYGWVDVFWSATNIVSGQTYYLVADSPNSNFVINYINPANYAAGNAVYNGDANYAAGYYDLAFRTYSDVASTVPLPAALPLLLVALGGLGFVASRRKAAC